MNRQESARLVATILAAHPGQSARLDEKRQLAMVDTFQALLGDLGYERCNAALRVLLQTHTWMPSIAEIRAAVLELERGPKKPGGEAWGAVQTAIHDHGVYRRPGVDFHFDDPLTARCVSTMNWEALCLSGNLTADRARFVELYDQLATQARREATAPLLASAREARKALQARSGEARPIAALLPKVAEG